MGFRVLQCLILLMCFFLCSGTLVRVSYDGSNSSSSSPADLVQLLKRNSISHIRISNKNHGLLSAVCGNRIDVDLLVSMKNIEAVSKSRALAVAWVQREVSSFIGCTTITIVVSSESMKEDHLPMLLPAIKAVDSALVSLKVNGSIKLSASFSLAFIEDCFRIHSIHSFQNFMNALVQVTDFLRKAKSCMILDAFCDDGLSLDDCLIRLRIRATSVLPDHDIPLQINVRNLPFSSPINGVKLRDQLTSQIGSSNRIRLLSLFIEKPSTKMLKKKELSREEERAFTYSHRKLIGSKVQSSASVRQLDVITPLATVPVVNPTTPTTTPVVIPLASPETPSTTTGTPVTNPNTSPTTAAPMSSGQSWCIASQTASQTALQVALDYACGYGGADCSTIQQGGSCYNPDTAHDHASYAFNNYYQKNPVPTSCNFGGTAVLTNIDPSTSTCQFPSTSTSSSVLNTTNPTGSAVFGSGPSSSSNVAPTSPSWLLFFTLACHLMPLIGANHL
ncbi:glucan endo-1,3-beta-glucosidase 3-like [Magnolia sinica]|uniref:glucan endo-1,3-beta-glucosidase 3-like n=1 Tax=Magnolia sinica TaxID=86752 RepID=UPI002659F204|nr:glucan endo-1,3-beta-glucosidase 3-like [Magnolia sinica]